MSYCYVWKKEDRVYMIADSATSSECDSDSLKLSSFGEKQGRFGKYYVSERQLKIYRINHETVAAFSGDVKHALELIYGICENCSTMSFEAIRDIMAANIIPDTEMVLVKTGEHPQIVYVSSEGSSAVNSCELGVGQENASFSEYVKEVSNSHIRKS